jgi:hypothetical protein
MVHVGDGSCDSIRRSKERCGTAPLAVDDSGVEVVAASKMASNDSFCVGTQCSESACVHADAQQG